MNKLFTKIATAFVGIAMAIGVGVAVGSHSDARRANAADTTVTWTATAANNLGSQISSKGKTATGTVTLTDGGTNSFSLSYTRTLVNLKSGKSDYISWQGSTWIQLGSSNALESLSFNTSAISGTIKSVSVTTATAGTHKLTIDVGGTKYKNAADITTYTGTAAANNPSPSNCVETGTGTSSGAITITIASSATTTNKAMVIRSVSITYAPPAYTISFAVNTAGYGTVSSSSITNVPSGSSISVSNNTVTINGTTITATPTANTAQYTYAFVNWSNTSGTITAARTITANFSRTTNTFTVGGSITGGSLDNTDSINYGGDLINQIKPDDGYTYPDDEDITIMMGSTDITASAYDSSDGSILYEGVTANITITASCKAVGTFFTVTYNANSGTVSPNTEQVIKDGNPTFPTPTRSGYNFKGWQVNGSGTAYFDPEDYTVTGDVTFVASWAAVYTVTFNSNGGSSSPASQSVETGSTFTFPSAGTKAHYSFDGWTSTGSEPYYAVGATSPAVTGTITYTAHWTADAQYTVTYTAGANGSGSFADTNQWSGSYTLKAFDALTGVSAASGYQFKNYTVNGQPKDPGDTITLSAATAVTVNFEEKPQESVVACTFSDLYDTNTVIDEADIELDANITIQFNKREGGTATQYYTNGSAVRWYGGGTLSVNGGTGVTITSIVITYSGGHSNDVSSDVGTFSEDITSGSGTGTWSGETDSVLFTQAGTSGNDRVVSITVTYTGGSVVVNYTITYVANAVGTEGSMSPTTGPSPQVAACAFTLDGYSFERWNTQNDGEGDDYAVGATVSEDVTLYAIWQEYIEPIGGNVTMTGVSSSTSVTVNGHPGIKCGTGKAGGSMTLTLEEANITRIKVYVAGWSADTTTVSVSIDNGTISESSLSLTSDANISGNGTTYTLDGDETLYVFTLDITNAPADSVITLSTSAGNKRFVVWGATDLFAETFANEFMTKMTCHNGDTVPTFADGYSWSQFESIYNGLDAQEQGRLHDADTLEAGSIIEQAMARYDYIEGRYNPKNLPSSDWKNFIGRTVTPIGNGRIMISIISAQTTNTSIIVIVTVGIAAIAIGGYFLLRKKKED